MANKSKNDKKKMETPKNNDDVLKNTEMLPQNIIQVGEREDEDKIVYIYQDVYEEIHEFTKDKTENESGGILVGNIVNEFGKTNIIIKGFIEAKHCQGTPTTLTFTHESWDYIHEIADSDFPEQIILGWIHTHPNFGIFLSEYDKFIQENFFKEDFQVAYVVDPIQNIEGLYIWVNEKITRCKGFYIFDKTGRKIDVLERLAESSNEEVVVSNSQETRSKFSNIPIWIISFVVIIMAFVIVSMNGKINTLQSEIRDNERAFQQIQQNQMILAQQANEIANEVSSYHETTTEESTDDVTADGETSTTNMTDEETSEKDDSQTTTTENDTTTADQETTKG